MGRSSPHDRVGAWARAQAQARTHHLPSICWWATARNQTRKTILHRPPKPLPLCLQPITTVCHHFTTMNKRAFHLRVHTIFLGCFTNFFEFRIIVASLAIIEKVRKSHFLFRAIWRWLIWGWNRRFDVACRKLMVDRSIASWWGKFCTNTTTQRETTLSQVELKVAILTHLLINGSFSLCFLKRVK